MKKKLPPDPPWTNFVEVEIDAERYQREPGERVFQNSRYLVFVVEQGKGDQRVRHLSIKRHDRREIHDWRDLQAIKNALCGEEWEGIEIYPAESRKVDLANQFHLWCFPQHIPIGFNTRAVRYQADLPKAKQRPFEPHHDGPLGETSAEEMQRLTEQSKVEG